ncbi:MAG: VWA domain-containing protein [Gaiellaceae bacterium]
MPRQDALERARVGRRARSLVSTRKGKYESHRLARPENTDIAFDATIRAAASRRRRVVEPEDLRRKVRGHRSPFVVCFVLDNSWSIHAERMVEKAKGIVFRLLEDATGRGDRVALVAFRGGLPEATVALPPTSSVALAYRRLKAVPLSGQTPLADALRRGRILLRQELSKHPNAVPLLVLVTDGLPTRPLRSGGDPLVDALAQARALGRARVLTVVADTSPTGSPGHAADLAAAAGGLCLPAAQLSPDVLLETLEQIA